MQRAWSRRSGLVIIALLAVLGSAEARASDLSKQWEVGADLLSTTMDNDTTIDDALGWRARGAYHFHRYHAAELTYDVVSADSNIRGSSLSYDLTKIMATYLGSFKSKKPDAKWNLYALFGLGRISYENDFDSDASTVFQTGGGVRILFSKHWAMRIDGRIWHFHGDSQIIPRDGFFSFDIAVGASCLFGGAK